MRQSYLRDQRGVAMLLELVLVAAVLGLAGLAVYQANHRENTASVQNSTQASSPEGLAESAAVIVEDDAAAEAAADANADAMTDELSAGSDDVTTLGGTANASF